MQPFAYLDSEYQVDWVNIKDIVFSPDGKYLVMGGIFHPEVWDFKYQQLVKTMKGWTNSVAFSPDGKQLAFTQGGKIQILDIASGEIIRTQDAKASIVRFSPDRLTYAAGYMGGYATCRFYRRCPGL